MAQLTVSAAARAVGKNRSTINRYIKSGRISVSKDASGNTVVETSELLRVFGELRGDGSNIATPETVAAPVASDSMHQALEATLELLKQQLKASQEREERLLGMLEQEQQSRRELERRLLPAGPSSSGVASASQEQDTHAASPNAAPSGKGFLAKLLGK